MRLVDSTGKVYTAHFKWDPHAGGVTTRGHLWKGLTTCEIHLGSCNLPTGTGRACGLLPLVRREAKRSESEPPKKRSHRGHVIAFRRAVEALVAIRVPEDQETRRKLERRALWASYNEALAARKVRQQQPVPESLDLRRREDVVKAIGHVAGHILRLLANG